MASGGGATGGAGGGRKGRHKTTYTDLVKYDDLITDVLVDKVSFFVLRLGDILIDVSGQCVGR